MEKLRNPYAKDERYSCFGCAPDNPEGLQLEFCEEGEYIKSTWKPRHALEGFINVLHGGIQATLLDEVASWVVFVKLGTAGVTSRMEVRYRRTVNVDKGEITVRGKLEEMKRNLAIISAQILDKDGRICAEARLEYYTFNKEKAQEKLLYPGKENFLPEGGK